MTHIVHHGDCREVMATLDAASVDAVVCDPPYGLSFMSKGWDHGVPGVEFWTEALRVAKPGAHLLAFGGTRTYHRLACAIEDAGWEIRDCVMWVYGSGFPKSHDVSKAIDKAAGAERQVVGVRPGHEHFVHRTDAHSGGGRREGWNRPWQDDADKVALHHMATAPATDAARQWSGWGTALKPAWEPIIVARKPLCGTVAENVMTHGTGGINVDGCRVGIDDTRVQRGGGTSLGAFGKHGRYGKANGTESGITGSACGRWPANVIHDGSDEVVGLFPQQQSGANPTRRGSQKFRTAYGEFTGNEECVSHRGADSGSSARFFYCAKASKADREAGLREAGLREAERHAYSDFAGTPEHGPKENVRARNHHPTVKPTALMRYLCRLVTPPGGVVLDPFTGSGSTGKAAVMEGFDFVGIEREAEYVEIARARIAAAVPEMEPAA
jgi:site-specific DNA-methyltransferase (adenine-specific)